MHPYRSMPEVCSFLAHGPLTLAEVEQRIHARLAGNQPGEGQEICGLAIEVEGEVVGDAMLRIDTDLCRVWIGYGFHPAVWGDAVVEDEAAVPSGVR